jgi:aspartyl-tRNA(Asn)/glutamyl-tRNA(Gln) amidotransferase subunit A
MDILELSAAELVNKIKQREISSQETTRAVLDNIEKVEPKIKAFLSTRPEQALRRAAQIDEKIARGEDAGLLCGLPVAVKDNICVKGEETTCASKILAGFKPPYNATLTTKLNDAGAVIVGKTNLDEFAMGGSTENSSVYPTHNPWNTDCVPGGSSGGSAVAVAAREAITSIGSDTGGSIRQPASFCGVTGLKPTYGRVSRYGLVAFASSLDQIGPLGKSVDDVALMMNAIAGYDKRDSTSVDELVPDYTAGLDGNLKNLKIGVPIQYFEKGLDREVKAAVEKAMESLHKLGAHLIEVNMPHTEYAIATYYILATAEASSNLARYDGVKYGHRTEQKSSLIDMYKRTKDEGFGDEVKRRILLGTYVLSSGYYDAYYLKAQKVRTLVKQDFDHAFEKVDCLITPTSPSTAYHIGENIDDPLKMYLMDIFTISANLAGIPGLSVPCGFDHKGLPIGFQLLGKVFGEETVLKIGHAYQQQTDFHTKRPPVLDEETAEVQS